ncbi:MAG: CPBP family intramembrane glutamic endopeptidase [Verrucomicrobiota bacterium]
MKRFFQSEPGATVLWVLSSLLLAAVMAPWIYQAGKGLAGAAEAGRLPAVLEWLGAACGRADFGRYFSRALVISAVMLLPFLFCRVRAARAMATSACDACVHLSWKQALLQIAVGLVIAGGLLWAMGLVLGALGSYTPRANGLGIGKVLGKILVPALAVPLLEEWLFRGLLLGLWLRFSKPLAACVGTSLVFAFIHFLKPPDGTGIADPASALAGFELLGKILLHFTEPLFFITDFASLFGIGVILAVARIRTGALWFSIGLHAGWILAFKGFNLLYRSVPDDPLHPWGIGETLRSGFFPMLTLGLTALICHFVMRRFEPVRIMR